jgi:hypothetical protein
MNKMDKIEICLFGAKLSRGKNAFIIFFTIASLAWLPQIEGLCFIKNPVNFILFAFIYFLISLSFYVIFGRTMASKKQKKVSIPVKLICLLVMIILDGIMVYLYVFRILVTQASVGITVPISLIVTYICVRVWTGLPFKWTKEDIERILNE